MRLHPNSPKWEFFYWVVPVIALAMIWYESGWMTALGVFLMYFRRGLRG